MHFQDIIKQEWEKEFPSIEEPGQLDEYVPNTYEESIFCTVFEPLIKKICVKVWNHAIETCVDNVEVICDSSDVFLTIDKQSVLKLKL